MLIVAFSLLATGYFAAGHMSSYALVFLALLVMATGAGLFKPIISGTIARTTDEKTSSFGFGIYYWMINLGAFLAPLVVSWLKGFSWQYVFTASAAYCAAMLLPALFLYREPPRPESRKTLKEVLGGAAEVLGDARFMLMIVVYSGFWILYFQNFGSVLWYLRDFVDREPVSAAVTGLLAAIGLDLRFTFDAEHVTVINAGTIILLQVIVSRLVAQPQGAADHGHGHGHGGGGLCPARELVQPVGVHPRHRGVLDRRDDRPPQVLQLRRAGGARRPQGGLHGLRLPLRRLRLAARLQPRRLPLRADAEAGGGNRGGGRPDHPVLDDLRRARPGRGGGLDPVRAGVRRGHPRHPAAGTRGSCSASTG